VEVIERRLGVTGWFTVAPSSLDAAFASGSPDSGEIYKTRFASVPLGRYSPPCDWLAASLPPEPRPVWILVHGVKGDGPEWWPVAPLLTHAKPAAIFMFRWVAYAERDTLVEELAGGTSRIVECLRGRAGPFIVLAHSAGGVLAARAAAITAVPAGETVRVYTVAAPLAGTGDRKVNRDGSPEATFMLDLGTDIKAYPAAAPRLEVTHLRTTFPSDTVMKPNRKGHAPNERGIGVPGAREVDLPVKLGHDDSLLWVARELAEGRDPAGAASPASAPAPASAASAPGGAGGP
jgi:pimeloyl-ACP methyl ester carboxylesterase